MGIVVAASARNSGNDVYWVSQGRGANTRDRAAEAGLIDGGTLARLCEICSVIVSVCPPEHAQEVAERVLQHRFRGLYIDANAISPQRAVRIGQLMRDGRVEFVDGGIIGLPSRTRGTTWLCLSGNCADAAASYFAQGPIETEVVGSDIGRASALKMCFAAYTKGRAALLCAIAAAADELGVLEDLQRHWDRSGPAFKDMTDSITHVAPKAWRFVSEMREIAATLESAGMPPEFHLAAAKVYRRLADFKDVQEPSLDGILRALRDPSVGC